MKEMSWYLLGVVTQSLWRGSPAQHPTFNRAIECRRAVLGLNPYARYQSHHGSSLSNMQDALCRFQSFNDVFLLRRDGKKAKAKANPLRTELVRKRNADKETNAETWTPSKKRQKMNAWWDYMSHKIDESKELNANVSFPKIHLICPCVKQIRQYGALQQYSPKWHEQAHKPNLKDGCNTSNHKLNYLPQVSASSVAFSASNSESSISKPSLSVERTALPPAKSSLAALTWLTSWAPSHMWSLNSWYPKTTVMESILMLRSQTFVHYWTIHKMECTTSQSSTALWTIRSIPVVTSRIYPMNNSRQWRSVFTMLLRLKLRVQMVNAYRRFVDEQEARAGTEGTDRKTGCG
jgi:hypothetical protein